MVVGEVVAGAFPHAVLAVQAVHLVVGVLEQQAFLAREHRLVGRGVAAFPRRRPGEGAREVHCQLLARAGVPLRQRTLHVVQALRHEFSRAGECRKASLGDAVDLLLGERFVVQRRHHVVEGRAAFERRGDVRAGLRLHHRDSPFSLLLDPWLGRAAASRQALGGVRPAGTGCSARAYDADTRSVVTGSPCHVAVAADKM